MANVIDIIVKGHDQTSKIFRKIGREAEKAFQQAEQSFKRLENEMRSIPDIQIDADTSRARTEITALKKTIENLNANINLDTSKATVEIKILKARIEQFERKDIKIDVKANTRLFMSSIAALAPAITPVLGVAVAAVGGLTAAFAAAGAGAIAFAAVAVPAIKRVIDGTGELTKKEKEARKAFEGFQSFWKGFASQFREPVLDIFIQSLSTLQTALTGLKPVFASSIQAVAGLLKNLDTAIKSSEMRTFFDWLGKNAGPAITAFGKAFGNTMRGIMNLMVAFGPVATEMQNGLVGITQKFADWSAGLSKSQGFQQFMSYVRANAPTVISLIKNVSAVIGNLLVILAPIGSIILSALNVAIGGLRTFTDAVKNAFSTGNFSSIPLAFITLINTILQSILSRLPMFIQAGLQMLTSLAQGIVTALPSLVAMISNLITTILNIIVTNLPLILTAGINILLTLIQGIVNTLPQLTPVIFGLINTIINIITQNLPLLIALGVMLLHRLIDGIIQMMPTLINIAMQIIMEVINAISRNLPQIIAAGIKIILSLVDGISKALPSLITAAVNLIVKIIQGISRNLPQMIAAGVKIVVALVQGLSKAIPQIVAALPKIINAIKNGLSKVNWRQVGVDIISAIASGLKSIVLTIPRPKIPKINISAASTSVAGISIPYPKFSVSWFAKGGLFNGPTIAGLGEAGPEAIIPLSGPNMRPFAQTIAKEMGDGSPQGKQQNTTINIYEAQRTTDKEVLAALRKAAFLYG